MTQVTVNDLTPVISTNANPDFRPATLASHHRPLFSRRSISQMMEDPRVAFALELIKGPIHCYTKFFTEEESKNPSVINYLLSENSDVRFPYVVKSENKEIVDYVIKNLNTFWKNGVEKALSKIEWGYSGSEVIYKQNKDGKLFYDNLRHFYNKDLEVVTKNSMIVGFQVKENRASDCYLGIPKGFWTVANRDVHEYYGRSCLFQGYSAWYETWAEGGARDVRRNWYYRNAFEGGSLYYPVNSYVDPSTGMKVDMRDVALSLLDRKRSGGYFVFPNQQINGQDAWRWEEPSSHSAPLGLQEYILSLSDEIFESLGIPPEIVQGGAGGLGSSSGRSIPLQVYYSTLRKHIDYLLWDFQRQILDTITKLSFGNDAEFDIEPLIPISEQMEVQPGQLSPDGKPSPSLQDQPKAEPKTSVEKKPDVQTKQNRRKQ